MNNNVSIIALCPALFLGFQCRMLKSTNNIEMLRIGLDTRLLLDQLLFLVPTLRLEGNYFTSGISRINSAIAQRNRETRVKLCATIKSQHAYVHTAVTEVDVNTWTLQ